jgi:hypothetical protein
MCKTKAEKRLILGRSYECDRKGSMSLLEIAEANSLKKKKLRHDKGVGVSGLVVIRYGT